MVTTTTITCECCNLPTLRTGNRQKYCPDCAEQLQIERTKESLEIHYDAVGAINTIPTIKTITCRDCGTPVERTGVQQKYCKPCAKKRKVEVVRKAYERYKAKNSATGQYRCIDCDTPLPSAAKRCKPCRDYHLRILREHRASIAETKTITCEVCGKTASRLAGKTMCLSCEGRMNAKNGNAKAKELRVTNPGLRGRCIDCNKSVSPHALRCKDCRSRYDAAKQRERYQATKPAQQVQPPKPPTKEPDADIPLYREPGPVEYIKEQFDLVAAAMLGYALREKDTVWLREYGQDFVDTLGIKIPLPGV